MKSDSSKPHCHQGGRSRGLTRNALLLGWGWELHLKGGPCWHCPGALPSSAQKEMEGRHPAQLFWHYPTGELKCSAWFQGGGWEINFQLGPVEIARGVGFGFSLMFGQGKEAFLKGLVGASWWFWVGGFCSTLSKIYGSQYANPGDSCNVVLQVPKS